MRTIEFYAGTELIDWASRPAEAETLIDLDKFVHPMARGRARAAVLRLCEGPRRIKLAVRVPSYPDPDDLDLLQRGAIRTVVLGDIRTSGEVEAWIADARSYGIDAHYILELHSGAGLFNIEDLVQLDAPIRGIWYGHADLVSDFDESPADMYFYDNIEPRLAAPRWVRSRLLTIARAYDLELWGQLDVTVWNTDEKAAGRALELAERAGFDVLVVRGQAYAPTNAPG